MESKLIVITGVTHGCGRAMVDEFIRLGHRVAGCGRSTDELENLRNRHGAPHDFVEIDVRSDEAVADWAVRVFEQSGAADLLINNAGVINRNARLWKIDAAEFDHVVDVNLKGVANVIRHFVPAMVARGAGVIVNFSSGWGRSVDAEVAPYCATKWAVEGLTRALALELPAGMAAVPLSPGIINTRMLQSCFGGAAAAYPSPEEWAGRAVRMILGLGERETGRPLSVD